MRLAFSSSGGGVEVAIAEPGSLGVQLKADSEDGPPRVQHIVPGGQMAKHPEVKVGMTLLAVDGQVVSGYAQVCPSQQALAPVEPRNWLLAHPPPLASVSLRECRW